MPKGLRMVAGSAASTPTNPEPWSRGGGGGLSCISAQTEETVPPIGPAPDNAVRAMPHCPSGSRLHFAIGFPRCWDGVNLDSADHRSHVSGGRYDPTHVGDDNNLDCPPSHPVPLPSLSVGVDFPVGSSGTVGWRLSSDMYDTTNSRGGYSLHADFYNGWNEQIKALWVTKCLNERRHCADGELGDGRALSPPVRGTGVVSLAASTGDAWLDQLIASSMCGSGPVRAIAAGSTAQSDEAPAQQPLPPSPARSLVAMFEPRRLFGPPIGLLREQWAYLVAPLNLGDAS
jgi:Domain of unknown function (DUF1996)